MSQLRARFFQEIATALQAGYGYDLSALLPDPDPILRKTGRSAEIYAEIRADAKVSACIESRKAGCLSMLWDLQSRGQDQATEVIRAALERLDMPKLMSEILEAFLWGYQPLEIMWQQVEGLTLPHKVVGKPPHWFAFDAENNLRFLSIKNPLGELLPERKFLLAQHHATYANPYGEKLLPRCFWPVTFKKGGWRWWVTATEKYGMPFIIGKVPRGTERGEQDQFLEALEQLVQDAIAILPNDSEVQILDGNSGKSSQSVSPHKELIEQCNAEIALAIVGQTLTSEIGRNGSYAAAKAHNEVREEIVAGDKRMLERVVQQLVDWIFEFNWSGQSPLFSLYPESDVNRDLAERDKILFELGARYSKEYLLKAYGFSPEDLEMDTPTPKFSAFAKGAEGIHLADYLPSFSQTTELAQKLTAPVVKLLRKGKSYQEIEKRLSALYPQLAPEEFSEALNLSLYLANVGGRLSAP